MARPWGFPSHDNILVGKYINLYYHYANIPISSQYYPIFQYDPSIFPYPNIFQSYPIFQYDPSIFPYSNIFPILSHIPIWSQYFPIFQYYPIFQYDPNIIPIKACKTILNNHYSPVVSQSPCSSPKTQKTRPIPGGSLLPHCCHTAAAHGCEETGREGVRTGMDMTYNLPSSND